VAEIALKVLTLVPINMYKRERKTAQSITLKNEKAAIQGICPVCGTIVFRMGKA
jgi:predicted RNA-binding Zn-ribbon protein involved in translation (DUF1610 family)